VRMSGCRGEARLQANRQKATDGQRVWCLSLCRAEALARWSHRCQVRQGLFALPCLCLCSRASTGQANTAHST
jgi:hypothetical protein